MENKNLTICDIKTFQKLYSKLADAIHKYIEHRYPEINDFWIDSFDIFDETIIVEVVSEDACYDFDIIIDNLINYCNNEN